MELNNGRAAALFLVKIKASNAPKSTHIPITAGITGDCVPAMVGGVASGSVIVVVVAVVDIVVVVLDGAFG